MLFIRDAAEEMFDCFRKRVSVQDALVAHRKVESMLQEMCTKYVNIRADTLRQFKVSRHKSSKMALLRKKKMLDFHIEQCHTKIAVCVQKQYALEQLEVTKMQVDAIRSSTSVFRSFSKYNPIDKIEDLQAKMEEMAEDLADVTDLLSSSSLQEFDETELEAELRQMECDTGCNTECGETIEEEPIGAPVGAPIGAPVRELTELPLAPTGAPRHVRAPVIELPAIMEAV